MQIKELPRGGQYSLKGNVVNVAVDILPTILALPRNMADIETIPIKLKRKLCYKSSVFAQNVRPQKVLEAMKWLLQNGTLFQEMGIQFNELWYETNHTEESRQNENELQNSGEQSDLNVDHSFDEITDNQYDGNMDTLLTGAEYDMSTILTIAPGENRHPLSFFCDEDAEYLSFPTIYCGQRSKKHQTKVHYSEMCKWEIRNMDRRLATYVPNLFFKLKKIQIKQIAEKVSLAIRRCKLKGKKYTVSDVLNDPKHEKLIKLDEGYHIFRSLRNSAPYLNKRKKDLVAMIRQLGYPTYFVSLSAADTRWLDLIRVLGKQIDNKCYSDEELTNMDWSTKTRLIKSDPVTCVRYLITDFKYL
ncbi:hypothetical protein HOLleu_00548 [Holothuria leucospilota]|uniref:DUF6570 domain-containing protein n=1 Tax=Holothuria leucospilota TaxID=206669 RepID=A0A9Q1CNT0_HOLLE|nr:hypothetical protein HOLleu_00548 [Holothuria leucospilota]